MSKQEINAKQYKAFLDMQLQLDCIFAWKAKLEMAREGAIDKLDRNMGVDHCAFCRNYFREKCKGCPIMRKTGRACCMATPYTKVSDIIREWELNEQTSAVDVLTMNDKALTDELQKRLIGAVQEEIDFLSSL